MRRGFSVKNFRKLGAAGVPKRLFRARLDWRSARRMAGIAAAVSSVVAAGTLSAMFVDHLAERAVMRAAAEAPATVRETIRAAAADKAEAALAAAKVAPKPAAPPQRETVQAKAAPAGLKAAAPAQNAATAALKPVTSAPKFPGQENAPPAAPAMAYAEQGDATERQFDTSASENGDPADETATAAIATVPLPASAPFPEPRDEEASKAEEEAEEGREARVTKYVNLRSGPNDESRVVAVVPAKASVSVLDCKAWCEVVFDGKKGWIYKRFIRES
jgi:SH3-like domain-containing protein